MIGDVHKVIMDATIEKIWLFQTRFQEPEHMEVSNVVNSLIGITFQRIIFRDADMFSKMVEHIYDED